MGGREMNKKKVWINNNNDNNEVSLFVFFFSFSFILKLREILSFDGWKHTAMKINTEKCASKWEKIKIKMDFPNEIKVKAFLHWFKCPLTKIAGNQSIFRIWKWFFILFETVRKRKRNRERESERKGAYEHRK